MLNGETTVLYWNRGDAPFEVRPVDDGVPIFMWNRGVQFEEAAIKQLVNLAKMPFVYKHIAAMPDTHWGMGATVGSVFASNGAVIPAAVGVDIGCGMIAARTNLTANEIGQSGVDLEALRAEIERLVPMGRTNNGGRGDRGAWFDIPTDVEHAWNNELFHEFVDIVVDHPTLAGGNNVNHLGTLGTGNHFIEIQFDEEGRIWIMLHSGSRGIGNKIGSYYIKRAKELMEKFHIKLPDPDLAYLPEGEPLYNDYLKGLHWAQKFAFINRQIMLKRTFEALQKFFPHATMEEEINTHHNYASIESHYGRNVLLTRKGAIRARVGDLGIIPGSMGTRSYIVRGLGNPLSFHSCSHGAGRAMSRNEAKRRFTLEDHAKATEGVVCRKDEGVLDETPGAYKDIDAVIEAERDLVSVEHTLKQIITCKG